MNKLKCQSVLFIQGDDASTWLDLLSSHGANVMLEAMRIAEMLDMPDDTYVIEHEHPARYDTELTERHLISYSHSKQYIGVDRVIERVE